MDPDRVWAGARHVSTLIALGTPHFSQERWTRWNIDFVNDTYPGAFHDSVRYVCVAGKSTFGEKAPWWKAITFRIATRFLPSETRRALSTITAILSQMHKEHGVVDLFRLYKNTKC